MRTALLLFIFAILAAQLTTALESAPKAVYRQRRVALSEKLHPQCALVFAASENDYHAPFRQDNDFYYLTGWNQPGAVLLIVAARPEINRPYAEVLFLPEKPTALAAGATTMARTPGAIALAGVDQVESVTQIGQRLLRFGVRDLANIYTRAADPVPNAAATLAWLQENVLRKGASPDLTPALKAMREVKDDFELGLIRKAANASVAAHLAAMKALKPGMYEYQLATLMEYEYRKRGCERPAYTSIAASGANAAFDHYTENTTRMKAGDLVLLDVAGEYSMYAADVTRTLPISGKYSDRQRELYRLVRGAEMEVIRAFRAGRSTLYGPNALHSVYQAYLTAHGMAAFATGGIGHLVGLNVHDGGENAAAFTGPLVPGSVFNIEPKIYVPQEKIGIGIEDTFWVAPDGRLVNLTGELPVEPEDIERVMAGEPH
jgi:Xaa-Pro aminopeptidase